MIKLIKKCKLFLSFFLILLFFICINNNVKASSEDIYNVRSSIINACIGHMGSDEYGTVNESSFNKDLSIDHTQSLYFIYDNPDNNCYNVIVLITGNRDIKTGKNGFVINNSNSEHNVYQNLNSGDWRNNVQFKNIVIDYSYNYVSDNSYNIGRYSGGTYNINNILNISNATYDNLLMVSPNYINTFLKIFPNFKERIINNIPRTFYLEYNENLKSYIVYSQWYGITDNELYSHQHYYKINPTSEPTSFNKDTYDLEGWLNMEGSENEIGPGAEFNEENDKVDMDVEKVRWRVGLKIIDYGTYYFVHYLPLSDNKDYEIVKFVITEDGEAYTETRNKNSSSWSNKQNITEISTIRENITSFNMYVIYDSYSAIIYSNYFRYDDRYTYTVSISYDNLNYSDDMLIDMYGHIPDEKAGYYRFYKEVTENRTYYFRLRVFDPETGGSLIDTKYTTVVVNGNFYLGGTVDDVNSYRKSSIYKLLKNKLGILFYPIDITFEFFERLSKVEFGEPSISVPTIREYFTGAVIINGFTFNLNSVLQNDTINQVYNIYLMFVDFIIYILIFGFLYKVFKEFFNIGGLFNG